MKKYLITILTSSDLDILKLTIDSALGQIYKNYDLYIVVNTINNEYYSKVVNFCNKNYDDKITKILETPSNGKPGKGHNSLLKIFNEIDYEYLVICDGDDFLYPTALTRIDNLINKNNYDTIVFCGNSSSIIFSEYSCTEKMCLKTKSYEFK